jgi:hypothetical protein
MNADITSKRRLTAHLNGQAHAGHLNGNDSCLSSHNSKHSSIQRKSKTQLVKQ